MPRMNISAYEMNATCSCAVTMSPFVVQSPDELKLRADGIDTPTYPLILTPGKSRPGCQSPTNTASHATLSDTARATGQPEKTRSVLGYRNTM